MWHEWSTLKKLIWLRKFAAGVSFILKTVTGAIVHITDAIAGPVEALSVSVEPVQAGTGDPSPDNVRPITGWNSVNIYRSGADTSDPTEYTITLGETVYGGTLDVVNGKMTVDRVLVTLQNPYYLHNWYSVDESRNSWGFYINGYEWIRQDAHYIGPRPTSTQFISDKWKVGGVYGNENVYCASFTNISDTGFGYFGFRLPKSVVRDVTSAADLDAAGKEYLALNPVEICYSIPPFELTLTPEQISTLQGTNNVWSDAGDVTVTYRASAS